MKTAIMGFGNPVRSDDGIGMYVIEALQKSIGGHKDISIFDMGTAAFEVLFGLKGHDKIIMVDAVIHSNEAVGTLFKVPAEAVLRAPQDDPMVFLHSMKWDQALSYAKKILGKEYPEDIQVYLIAIETILKYTEEKEALNTHQEGSPAITLDELYDNCAAVYLKADTTKNRITFRVDEAGIVSSCGYTPKNCADDCFKGIHITKIKWLD